MIIDNIIIDKNFKTIEDQLRLHKKRLDVLAHETRNLKEFIQEIHRLIENFGYERSST